MASRAERAQVSSSLHHRKCPSHREAQRYFCRCPRGPEHPWCVPALQQLLSSDLGCVRAQGKAQRLGCSKPRKMLLSCAGCAALSLQLSDELRQDGLVSSVSSLEHAQFSVSHSLGRAFTISTGTKNSPLALLTGTLGGDPGTGSAVCLPAPHTHSRTASRQQLQDEKVILLVCFWM